MHRIGCAASAVLRVCHAALAAWRERLLYSALFSSHGHCLLLDAPCPSSRSVTPDKFTKHLKNKIIIKTPLKYALGNGNKCYIGGKFGVGLVDSAREDNKARAVVEIYLEPGAMRTPLAPF